MDPSAPKQGTSKKRTSLLQSHRRKNASQADSLTIGTQNEKSVHIASNLLSPKQRQALQAQVSSSVAQQGEYSPGSAPTSGSPLPLHQNASGGTPTSVVPPPMSTSSSHSDVNSHGMDPLLQAIHEYLLYTGLSSTSSTLLKELKQSPPLPYHQTSKLVSLLLNHIHQFQFSSLLHDWNLLAEKFQFPSAESLQMKFSLVKYYFVVCIKKGKLREMEVVLREHAWWIHRHDAFRDWFVLPFLMRSSGGSGGSSLGTSGSFNNILPLSTGGSNTSLPSATLSNGGSPSTDFDFSQDTNDSKNAHYLNKIPPSLKVYFDPQWIELLSISLHNFLHTSISKSKQKPRLMRMEKEYERTVLRLEKALVSLQRDNHILERKMNAMHEWIRTRSHEKSVSSTTPLATSESSITSVACHQPQEILADHRGAIDSLKFSCGGLYLATASSDRGVLKIYSSSSNHKSQTYDLFSSTNGSGGASPGGNAATPSDVSPTSCTLEWNRTLEHVLFVGMGNRKIKIFDISKKRKISTLLTDAAYARVLNVCSNPVQQNCIAVSSVPSSNGTVSNMFSSRSSPSLSPSAQSLPPNTQGILTTFDWHTGQVIRKFSKSTPILHASYNHNGKLLAVASVDGSVRILDPDSPNDPVIMQWDAHSSPVTRVFFSCDETTLWSCGCDGIVRQWNMHKSGECIRQEQVYTEGKMISMTISPGEEQGNSFLSSTGVLYEEQMGRSSGATWFAGSSDAPLDAKPQHFIPTHRFQIEDERCVNFSCIDWNPAENLIAAAYKNRTYVYSAPFVYHR